MVKKAIIPAAGYGTRSLPITKAIPKEMFPIKNKPTIQLVVEEAEKAGIEEILIILSRQKNMIIDYFDRSIELETFLKDKQKTHLLEDTKLPNVNIQFIRQSYAKGLGDAVLLGKSFVGDDDFAVLLPDDLIVNPTSPGIFQLIETMREHDGSVIGLAEVEWQHLHKYGVIDGTRINDSLYQLENIVEKPTNPPTNKAVIGRYVFTPSIFSYLERVTPDTGGEIQLTEAIEQLLKEEQCFGKIIEGKRFDIGSFDEYLAINQYLSNLDA